MQGEGWSVGGITLAALSGLGGTLLGLAGADLGRARKQWRDDASAGSLAAFALTMVVSDALNLRAIYHRALDQLAGRWQGPLPRWLLPDPVIFVFSTAAEIDVKSLTFLRSDKMGVDVLIDCVCAADHFAMVKTRFESLQDSSEMTWEAVDKALASGPKSPEELKAAVGRLSRDRNQRAIIDCLVELNVCLAMTGAAYEGLRTALNYRFGKRILFTTLEARTDLEISALPKLPLDYGPAIETLSNRQIGNLNAQSLFWLGSPPKTGLWTWVKRKILSSF